MGNQNAAFRGTPIQKFLHESFVQRQNESRNVAKRMDAALDAAVISKSGDLNAIPLDTALADLDRTWADWLARPEMQQQVDMFFQQYDTNKDASLSIEEYSKVVRELLQAQKDLAIRGIASAFEANKDRIVELGRLCEYTDSEMADREKAARKSAEVECVAVYDRLLGQADLITKRMFTKLDKNADGKISRSEFMNGFLAASKETVAEFLKG